MKKNVIVSLADANYFLLLEELISITNTKLRKKSTANIIIVVVISISTVLLHVFFFSFVRNFIIRKFSTSIIINYYVGKEYKICRGG